MAGEHPLERVDVEAVLVHGDADHARAGALERDSSRRMSATRRNDDVARLEQRARHEVDALAGARGDDDLVGLLGQAALARRAGELLAQLGQPSASR